MAWETGRLRVGERLGAAVENDPVLGDGPGGRSSRWTFNISTAIRLTILAKIQLRSMFVARHSLFPRHWPDVHRLLRYWDRHRPRDALALGRLLARRRRPPAALRTCATPLAPRTRCQRPSRPSRRRSCSSAPRTSSALPPRRAARHRPRLDGRGPARTRRPPRHPDIVVFGPGLPHRGRHRPSRHLGAAPAQRRRGGRRPRARRPAPTARRAIGRVGVLDEAPATAPPPPSTAAAPRAGAAGRGRRAGAPPVHPWSLGSRPEGRLGVRP